ncbi:hypothetical protein JYU34_003462 [Plutella xylostella]|uniref:Secreted protein n=1 Tax=Plutella xylostella TaxID=51655 RepID=A0ABQ7R039_PLUXY|nr:hypothetical protein JYU34_003462 [Plutella xylostella]
MILAGSFAAPGFAWLLRRRQARSTSLMLTSNFFATRPITSLIFSLSLCSSPTISTFFPLSACSRCRTRVSRASLVVSKCTHRFFRSCSLLFVVFNASSVSLCW